MADVQQQTRQLGDTRIAIAATLTRPDGTVVDLTGLTPYFKMCFPDGTVKVAETSDNVSATDETAGEVQYSPQAADVDTVGTFNAYFIAETAGGAQDTFPVVSGQFQIVIKSCK